MVYEDAEVCVSDPFPDAIVSFPSMCGEVTPDRAWDCRLDGERVPLCTTLGEVTVVANSSASDHEEKDESTVQTKNELNDKNASVVNSFKQKTMEIGAKMFFFACQSIFLKRYSKYFRIWTSYTTKKRTSELENNQKSLLIKLDEQQNLVRKSSEKNSATKLIVGLKIESNYKGQGTWYDYY